MFKERLNPTTTLKVQPTTVPVIFISQTAIIKMQQYVELCTDEIGWLGTAYRKGNEILIDDVYLFHQEVHGTTTEITVDGLSIFGEALMERADGMDVWNNLKVWGHSHVRMGVTPSGQDDSQMNTFASGGHDWFIRIICNKLGEMKVDLYDFNVGVIYLDLSWKGMPDKNEKVILDQIDELYGMIEALHEHAAGHYKASILVEMAEKVKKKTWTNYQSNYQKGTAGGHERKQLSWQEQIDQEVGIEVSDEQKKSSLLLLDEEVYEAINGYSIPQDCINNIDIDFWTHFTSADIEEIAYCRDEDDLDSLLWESYVTYKSTFSRKDLRKILDFAKNRCFAGRGI